MLNELFIGRETELNYLRDAVFFVKPDSFGRCISLFGPNGIGKTALIKHLIEEFKANPPQNTFCFVTSMSAVTGLEENIAFSAYWIYLLEQFSDEIDEAYLDSLYAQPTTLQKYAIKKIKATYRLINSHVEHMETEDYHIQLRRSLDDLFRYYTIIGVRIIIIIDDFDRARSIFPGRQFFQYLENLTPKGSLKRLNLSIITISRCRFFIIAHDMQDDDGFHDAFSPLALKGFSKTELSDYFATYNDLPCGPLPEEMQKQVLYFFGRSPRLLMMLRHEFEVMDEPGMDIDSIFAEYRQFIYPDYDHMIALMKMTFVDRTREKTLLDVFIQKFIGSAYDDNFNYYYGLSLLYDYGFVTKETTGSDIFTMSGVMLDGLDELTEGKFVYEPIAPYFVEYIKNMIAPNDISIS